jgi:hypothetical protein
VCQIVGSCWGVYGARRSGGAPRAGRFGRFPARFNGGTPGSLSVGPATRTTASARSNTAGCWSGPARSFSWSWQHRIFRATQPRILTVAPRAQGAEGRRCGSMMRPPAMRQSLRTDPWRPPCPRTIASWVLGPTQTAASHLARGMLHPKNGLHPIERILAWNHRASPCHFQRCQRVDRPLNCDMSSSRWHFLPDFLAAKRISGSNQGCRGRSARSEGHDPEKEGISEHYLCSLANRSHSEWAETRCIQARHAMATNISYAIAATAPRRLASCESQGRSQTCVC